MAVIEEEPGVVIDCQSRPKTAVAEDAPLGYCSDGYETASDTELNNSVPDNDNATTDNRNNVCSVKSGDDEVSREVNEVESQENTEIIKAETNEKALVQANEAKLEGNSLFKAGQFEEALSKYEIAIQVVTDDPSSNEIRSICHANRAACFSKLGKHEETIKECTKALELNPSYMKALLRRGEARENLEQYEESIADMTKILELDPSNDQARRSIIRLKPLADEKREKMKEEMMANNQDPNAIPVEQVALPPPPQQNLVGPIGVADPSRDLVAERCQVADRDRNATVNQRARYGPPPVRANVRHEPDPSVETPIFSTAALFPYYNLRYPAISTYLPNTHVLLYLVRYMDFNMASTKHWTDNCMGWTPLHSMIYISQLFMIQTLRSMESSGAFPPSSEYAALLNGIRLNVSLENVWIPGPLVQFFKNLACFSATESHGPVTPALPAIPTWDRATKYALLAPFNRYLPNIAAMISRLRTICTTSDRDGMTESLFLNDVNGPHRCATLFGQALTDDEFDRLHMTSPGIGLSLPGNLRLWQNASAVLDSSGFPAAYDSEVDEVLPSWGMYMNLYNVVDWFGPVIAMMSKYCQFWKGSAPLSDCAPNCSAAGAVKCEPLAASNMFAQPTWVAQSGMQNHNSHGNANQIGHYTLHSSRALTISASSTLVDLPDSMYYAAITYCFNCRIEDVQGVRAGPFWAIYPDLIGRRDNSTLPGVLTSIVRDYHNDTN